MSKPLYMPGSEIWEKRLKEALKKNEKPIEIFCFGTDKFELIRGIGMPYNYGYRTRRSKHTVKVFNEKLGTWQRYPCNDYLDVCPVCGRLMCVYYIPGTTYLACCSKECYEKYARMEKSMFGSNPNLPKFTEGDRTKFHE